jgi:DNA excision repair protein ERCC-4
VSLLKFFIFCILTGSQISSYLLSYEPIAFHGYLESIIESNANPSPTVVKQNPSPWLVSDAADVIFKTAKRRCYIQHPPKVVSREEQEQEEGWAVLDEMEGMQRPKTFDEPDGWQPWMPSGMEPVFEELPKWKLLGEVLQEIEETMLAQPMQPSELPSSSYVMSETHLVNQWNREITSP